MGLLVVCGRVPLVVAPAAMMRWFRRLIDTDTKIRKLGTIFVVLGAGMIWAGATEIGVLARILTIWGWYIVGASFVLLIIFPGVYRELASIFLPAEAETNLPGWRLIGGIGTLAGSLLIYYGVLAL